MVNSILIWLLDYVQYVLIFSITIALIRYKYLTNELKFIWYFLLLGAFSEISTRSLSYYYPKLNTLPGLHLYTILEFLFIGLFYHQFFGNFFNRKILPYIIIGFILLALINAFYVQGIFNFNTYASGLEGIIVIFLSLLCFYKMLIELDTREPTKQPIFWINSGFLFYFAGSLFVFILSNFIMKDNYLLSLAWGMHAFLMLILHLFLGIGLWHSHRR
ncbi:hypothetical protein GCM10011514_50890 [Emticicia aquatilis]|uniref:Uncharacterized protein n=1 Tax=Emticicia aquatilis TaxID=1537369 RepID=A0A917DYW0_9BACT|nr:hypothetical protein [Emticicia aquatilis]GGD80598.1 hypothetical protein GCM10011514_50890 [Emticicia aquatilis]